MSTVPSLVFFACMESVTHSVHDHAADLQDRHVCFLALVSLPHDGAHPFQAWVGAVQPGKVTLQGNQTPLNTDTSRHGNYYYYYFRSSHPIPIILLCMSSSTMSTKLLFLYPFCVTAPYSTSFLQYIHSLSSSHLSHIILYNRTQVSLPPCKPSPSLLLPSFCQKSPLTLVSTHRLLFCAPSNVLDD